MQGQRYNCPVEYALMLLGGKWKVVLLATLKQGPHRYAEIRSAVTGVSDKVLTERLRELVAAGLVVQSKHGGRGAPSRYQLSRRAEKLRPALEALYQWGLVEARLSGAALANPQDEA
jgi:DNA-binding HxlR family transcriptional regulator